MAAEISHAAEVDRSMRLCQVMLAGVPALFIASCVIVEPNPSNPPQAKLVPVSKSTPLRLNVRVSLECKPSCTYVGTDLGQVGKAIIAAYRDSGRFSVTPSDQVDFNTEIKLSIDREDDWLDAKVCNGTFGLIPAVWHDTVRMSTTYASRQGVSSRRFEQAADVAYRCHLFLAPLLPFHSEPDILDRMVTELSNTTIARAESERVFH